MALTLEQLAARTAVLETQNRRLRWGLTMLLIMAGVAGMLGVAKPRAVHELLRAKRIEVVDNHGVPLVVLEHGKHGGAVVVRTAEGKPLCHLSGNGQGDGTIATFHSHTRQGRALIAGDENGGYISVMAAKGYFAGGIAVDEAGGGAVSVNNAQGQGQAITVSSSPR